MLEQPQFTGSKALTAWAQSVNTVAVSGRLEAISGPPDGPIVLYFALRAEIFGRVEFINLSSTINQPLELIGLLKQDFVRAAEMAILSEILKQVTPLFCTGNC